MIDFMINLDQAREEFNRRYADCIVNGHVSLNAKTDSCDYCYMKLITTPISDGLERELLRSHSPLSLEEQKIVDEKRKEETKFHIKFYSMPATAKIARELEEDSTLFH